MPITQDRMAALIAAADDYRHSMERIVQVIADINIAKERNQPYKESLALLLSINRTDFFLVNPAETIATLAAESAHLRATRGINIRKTRYQRRKREQAKLGDLSPDRQLELERMTLTGRFAPGTAGHAELLGQQPAKHRTVMPAETTPVPTAMPSRPSTLPHYDRFADGDPEDQGFGRPTYAGDNFVDEKDGKS